MSKRILFLVAFCGILAAAASAQASFEHYNFNVGAGSQVNFGDAGKFANSSFNVVAGGGLNFSRAIGANVEYMYYNLPIKSSVIQQQGLPGATGHQQSVTLNGIYTFRRHSPWGFYAMAGVGWYRRSVSATTQDLTTQTICQPAWIWWGISCVNGLVSPEQTLSSSTRDAIGYNAGGGVTYHLKRLGRARLFGEVRYHHAYHSDVATTVLPVTFGLRW